MSNKRVLAVASLALAAAAGPGAVPAAHASAASSMVDRMNAARQAHGLAPLRMSEPINRSSSRWARFLMRRDWLGHASLQAARVKGEIIEMHSGKLARAGRAMRGWMGSPQHRAIILCPRFHQVGVGKTQGRFAGRSATIWVARFR